MLAVATAVLVALTGCKPFLTTTTRENELHLLYADKNFDGFTDIARSGKSIRALMVHGMTEAEPYWSHDFQVRLGARISYGFVTSREFDIPVALWDRDEPVHARLVVSEFRCDEEAEYNCAGQPEILFYEVTWSPVTAPYKEWVRSTDLAGLPPAFRESRQPVNDKAIEVFTDSFMDPLYYLANPSKMQEPVSKAICAMVVDEYRTSSMSQADPCQLNDPGTTIADVSRIRLSDVKREKIAETRYVFFTYSLGSRILADTLVRMLHPPPPSGLMEGLSALLNANRSVLEEFRNSVTTVYMFANQISLFDPCRLNVEQSVCDQPFALRGGAPQPDRPPLTLVAFVDPNDMLSYPIGEKLCERLAGGSREGVVCANVFVSVASPAYSLRALDGCPWDIAPAPEAGGDGETRDCAGADPLGAHTGYDRNEAVLDCVLHGSFPGGAGRCVNTR